MRISLTCEQVRDRGVGGLATGAHHTPWPKQKYEAPEKRGDERWNGRLYAGFEEPHPEDEGYTSVDKAVTAGSASHLSAEAVRIGTPVGRSADSSTRSARSE
jgi:hypothetical protein